MRSAPLTACTRPIHGLLVRTSTLALMFCFLFTAMGCEEDRPRKRRGQSAGDVSHVTDAGDNLDAGDSIDAGDAGDDSDANSLYASDWAHAFVQRTFPEMVRFYGNDPTNISHARAGYAPQDIVATVNSPEMLTLLGQNTVTLRFSSDSPQWVVAQDPGPNAVSHFQGRAVLCNTSTSSCGAGGPILDDSPLLITEQMQGGGTVVYTAFHNRSQGGLDANMEAILNFLILQL